MIVDAHNDLLVEVAHFRHEAASVPRSLARPAAPRRRGPAGVPGVRGRERTAGVRSAPQPHPDRRVPPGGGRRPGRRAPRARRRRTWRRRSADGRIALLLSMEGAEPLGYDPALVDVFWLLGVRMFALTWNRRNPFADGLGEANDGGLSDARPRARRPARRTRA